MSLHAVLDASGVRWDVCTSKQAANASKAALTKRQPAFRPFRVEEIEPEENS